MTAVVAVLVLVLTAPLVPSRAGAAPAATVVADNAVITWSLHTQTVAYEVARQAPYRHGRTLAIVGGAVYDAANAVAGVPYEPFLVAPRVRRGASMEAAVASAAYGVLAWLFPEQETTLRGFYDEALAGVRHGRAKRDGIAVGEAAAGAMIAARRDDGAGAAASWAVGTEPGQWRPTPPGFLQDGAEVADIKPFVIADGNAYRTAGPPALTSRRYARELNEIKALGAIDSTVRTQDQTESAIWWHDRRQTEWEIKRQIARNQRLGTLETARLFAMADIARADATIACFNEKRHWGFWRPVTAVREAGADGNPATSADPNWTPLLITPPFPDHTSGHSCSTGAIMTAMRRFFGRDDIAFSAYSVDSGTTRGFGSFSEALAEVIEARIWGGVHFRSADVQGVDLGEQVAGYVLAREFRRR
ncbi:vanadium-dependent haloperoxidase [Actinoplanes sp. GCM10030250]|uniref:vanadium-dependent haloperoxidase n=1 Tax=Actinoplanes sp. GCM10030250 TaxID=3273376 RepID=UPI0036166F8B